MQSFSDTKKDYLYKTCMYLLVTLNFIVLCTCIIQTLVHKTNLDFIYFGFISVWLVDYHFHILIRSDCKMVFLQYFTDFILF